MLKITKNIEYSLIAIRHMNNNKKICSAREISNNYNIPYQIMAKTLQKLSKAKYVNANKGARGGYYLNSHIKKVNLIDFIEQIEGPLGLVQCITDTNCNLHDTCNIKSPLNKINNNIRNILSKVTLDEIAN
jgi:Rrf2 family protein